MTGEQLQELYNQPAGGPGPDPTGHDGRRHHEDAGALRDRPRPGAIGWVVAANSQTGGFAPWMGGMIGMLVLGLVIVFKKTLSVPLILPTPSSKGLFLGAVSEFFLLYFDHPAHRRSRASCAGRHATLATFTGMFLAHRFGLMKVTTRFRRVMTMMIIGYAVRRRQLHLRDGDRRPVRYRGSGGLGIAISPSGSAWPRSPSRSTSTRSSRPSSRCALVVLVALADGPIVDLSGSTSSSSVFRAPASVTQAREVPAGAGHLPRRRRPRGACRTPRGCDLPPATCLGLDRAAAAEVRSPSTGAEARIAVAAPAGRPTATMLSVPTRSPPHAPPLHVLGAAVAVDQPTVGRGDADATAGGTASRSCSPAPPSPALVGRPPATRAFFYASDRPAQTDHRPRDHAPYPRYRQRVRPGGPTRRRHRHRRSGRGSRLAKAMSTVLGWEFARVMPSTPRPLSPRCAPASRSRTTTAGPGWSRSKLDLGKEGRGSLRS